MKLYVFTKIRSVIRYQEKVGVGEIIHIVIKLPYLIKSFATSSIGNSTK